MGYITNRKNRSPESYPERRGGGATPTEAFARNFASAPADQILIPEDPGAQVVWNSISSGAPASADVPITPAVTGIIMVRGVICLKNTSSDPQVDSGVQVLVQVGNPPAVTLIPFLELVTVEIGDAVVVPILTQTDPQPIGVPTSISILLLAGDAGTISLVSQSSSLEIQEVPAATG